MATQRQSLLSGDATSWSPNPCCRWGKHRSKLGFSVPRRPGGGPAGVPVYELARLEGGAVELIAPAASVGWSENSWMVSNPSTAARGLPQ